jgi:hypothetical protein
MPDGDLNQFVISRVLGSTIKHGMRPRFGPLGLLHAQNQVLAQCPKRGEQISFAPDTDKRIIRAFEETRKGFTVDRVLADPDLTTKFIRRCRELEVSAPQHAIALRLFRFRKSPSKKFRLEKPSAREPRRDFSPYLFAAEMALVQMKYRYGASVDDIMAYPDIGKEFDALSRQLYPGLAPLDYRLAALHVRKSRYCEKDERTLFNSLSDKRAESTLRQEDPLDRIDVDKFRQVDAIVGLVEEARVRRFLYITETEDVAQTIAPFTKETTIRALGNSFWTPALSSIRVYLYDIRDTFRNARQSLWAKRLIYDKAPIFNAPIHLGPYRLAV